MAGNRGTRARAVALHDAVRDQVRFGFTRAFDAATPAETLRAGRGHCNPQATLLVAALGAVDIPARQRFVTIERTILDGLFPEQAGPPERITHSYVEVAAGEDWVATDSYILDARFRRSAVARLGASGRTLGFGAHVDGAGYWDGRQAAFSQLVEPTMVLEDHGAWENPAAFYETDRYAQRLSVFSHLMFGWFAVSPANDRIAALRRAAT